MPDEGVELVVDEGDKRGGKHVAGLGGILGADALAIGGALIGDELLGRHDAQYRHLWFSPEFATITPGAPQ